MRMRVLLMCCFVPALLAAQTNSPNQPTWWAKYQYLLQHPAGAGSKTAAAKASANADASNECGPQSETSISLNPAAPNILAGGSNEIFRLAMRGYFSSNAGASWGAVDLPLPSSLNANSTRFGSDPGLAFDSQGNAFYSYIVVFYNPSFRSVTGTELAVARSTDGGQTWPNVSYFNFSTGQNHFNDKPMIAADTNVASPFRDQVYVAWDAAVGGSTGGGVLFARSADHGASFTVTRIDSRSGQGRAIGADPFVGPNGEVYVAWNDYAANTIAFNRSFDGGNTWGTASAIASKTIPFDIAIPAESFRGSLVYPSCGADRSSGPHRGRLFCSWMDQNASGNTDIFVSYSDNQGSSWSVPAAATDPLSFPVDRFNQWLSVDPVTGAANLSFYDTRNDSTGSRYMTDIFWTQTTDGQTWVSPNVRVTSASSNEHDCNGLFPCPGIDYGNQYGDYAGLVSYNGISYPIWTDSRDQLNACASGYVMEEVFSAAVEAKK